MKAKITITDIPSIRIELKSQQACEVAAEGGATRYPAFLTGGQPAGAVSRMAERSSNKRQRSPTHRDDRSRDKNPDPNATYVPSKPIIQYPFAPHCTNLLPFLRHLYTYCLSQRRQAAFDPFYIRHPHFQKLFRPSASTTPRFNHPAKGGLIIAITIIHPC